MYNYAQELSEKIKAAVSDLIKVSGYELIDLALRKVSGVLNLQFFVDRPFGGISLKECASLNEQLGELLDKENILDGRYILEVSSPGVDRPLKNEKDFLRAKGRYIRVFLGEPHDGKIELEGSIDNASEGILSLNTADAIKNIPLSKINKAKQVIK
jgi:ribosome maturation factor RimP